MKFSVGAVFLFYWLLGDGNSSPNFDEYNVAKLLGISPFAPIGVGLVVLITAWILLLRQVSHGERLLATICSSAGAVVGVLLYARVIGPWLLP
jgi:hypothetical protein